MASPQASAQQPPLTTLAGDVNGNKGTTNNPSSVATATFGPPATSLNDSGLSARPRDARTIHLVLASLGVSAYQERIPLQLLDFAYRYTAGILADAQHLAAEGYVTPASAIGATTHRGGKGGGGSGAGTDEGGLSLAALRLATASRNGYQFSSTLPKETLLEMAAEKNKTRLPEVQKEVVFGVRLPHERFVMTGTGWNMLEEWDSEAEDVEGHGGDPLPGGENGVMQLDSTGEDTVNGDADKDVSAENEKEDEEMEDEDGMEQMFGGDAEDEDGMEEG